MNMLLKNEPATTAALTPAPPPPAVRARSKRPSRLALSAWLGVALPTAVAAVYFGVFAADQYVVEARYAVRSQEAPATDPLGAMTGMPGALGTIADAFIVNDYMTSREIIEDIGASLDIEAIYNRDEADWFAKLGANRSIEDIVDYWESMVHVSYELTTGISTLEVKAFHPGDAVMVGQALLAAGEALVNRLSERARNDAVRFAQHEVDLAEARLTEARNRVTEFRNRHQSLDPAKTAETRLGLVAVLEQELAKQQAELAALRAYMIPGAPAVVSLTQKVEALRAQVRDEQSRLASANPAAGERLSELVAPYQRLLEEEGFAQQAYLSTLETLELARAQAIQQQRYLVTFVAPKRPEEATEPDRVLSVVTVFLGAFVVWGIGSLAVSAVKDHAGWV